MARDAIQPRERELHLLRGRPRFRLLRERRLHRRALRRRERIMRPRPALLRQTAFIRAHLAQRRQRRRRDLLSRAVTRMAAMLGEQRLPARRERRIRLESFQRRLLLAQQIARDVLRLAVLQMRIRHPPAGPRGERVLQKRREARERVFLRQRPERHRAGQRLLRRVTRHAADRVIQLPPALHRLRRRQRRCRRFAQRREEMRQRVRRIRALRLRQMREHIRHRRPRLHARRTRDEPPQMRPIHPRSDRRQIRPRSSPQTPPAPLA